MSNKPSVITSPDHTDYDGLKIGDRLAVRRLGPTRTHLVEIAHFLTDGRLAVKPINEAAPPCAEAETLGLDGVLVLSRFELRRLGGS